jgi:hypothetical protein
LPLSRIAAFVLAPRRERFAALAHKAGLKSHMLTTFVATLAAIKTYAGEAGEASSCRWRRRSSTSADGRDDPSLGKVLALLWRFADAPREEAAGFARDAVASHSRKRAPLSLDFAPENDDLAPSPN